MLSHRINGATHMGVEYLRGMLEAEVMFSVRPMMISKVALKAGSSRHGNALRAPVGCI